MSRKCVPWLQRLPQLVLVQVAVSSAFCMILFVAASSNNGGGTVVAAADGETVASVVTCGTTKGEIEMTFYRDWSPNGYDRAVKLFQDGFYDNSHFFRVVKGFLVQFGISYHENQELKDFALKPIQDDPVPPQPIAFEPGIISFAGSGENSRTSHLFISYIVSNQFGMNPWETPIGKVTKGMEVTHGLYSGYGDMPPWGKGPEQQPIYGGPKYIEDNFPLLDKFLTCNVETTVVPSSSIPVATDGSTNSETNTDMDTETATDTDTNTDTDTDSDSRDESDSEDEEEL